MYTADTTLDVAPDMIPTLTPEPDAPVEPAPVVSRPSAPTLGVETVVLKLGGSVLKSVADATTAASEIYRFRRRGARVVAVVSAVYGHTDSLLREAESFGERESVHARRLVGLGEERSAALVALACERVGLKASVLGPRELDLRAEGPAQEACPVSLDVTALGEAVRAHDVVVVPGFVACDEAGAPVLLGRGGSDMTAVFIASEAGLDTVRLVKDVDGVYDRDPALAPQDAQRYARLSYEEAQRVAGVVVQDRAIAFAQQHDVNVDVAAIGAEHVSRIGRVGEPPRPAQATRALRVAVAGCGVVGGGLLHHLARRPDAFEVCAVLVRDPSKPRDVPVSRDVMVTSTDDLFAAKPDVVIDAVSSGDDGHTLIQQALAKGVHVVSANKQAVVTDLPGLNAAAAKTGAQFQFSAAVGGGAPMVETIRQARAAGEIVSFEAVLNGTVNFMLDRLAEGASFDTALQEARDAGFAEEDPSADLEGLDASAKVQILAQEAFGNAPAHADIPRATLDSAAGARIAEAGGRWKQLGGCRRDGDQLTGAVELRSADSVPLFRETVRERNALRVELADGRTFSAHGRGAGRWPTAEAVWADLMDMRAQILTV